ncbi:MAG: rhodanese-like domain-containing protein [Elusimicrobiota bacterium]
MNAGDWQAYGIGAAVLAFFGWRYAGFRSVKKRLPELLKQGAVVVDVRSPGEFASGSGKSSLNIPLAELEKRLSRLDPEKPVVVCCASGARSAAAAAILRKHGFKLVFNAGPWTNAVASCGRGE